MDELARAKDLARAAGEKILEIYGSDEFSVRMKEDDSPLTEADTAANEIIVEGLRETGHAILSEESKDTPERLSADKVWIVDPLDGTKEFVKRNGEFTVNIALVENGRPVLGVIYAPALKEMYYGSPEGAFLDLAEGRERLQVTNASTPGKMTLVMSRSHAGPAEERLQGLFKETRSKGSSLKGCLVARGLADVYFRSGPTNEWDVAAMDCIVHAAGGRMTLLDGMVRKYNQEETLLHGFLVSNDTIHDMLLGEIDG